MIPRANWDGNGDYEGASSLDKFIIWGTCLAPTAYVSFVSVACLSESVLIVYVCVCVSVCVCVCVGGGWVGGGSGSVACWSIW